MFQRMRFTRRAMPGLLALNLLLAACGPAVAPTPTPTPEPPPDFAYSPEAVRAAQEALSAAVGVPVGQITVVSVTAVDWNDPCLEVYRPEELCAAVITPGYRVLLRANGQEYDLHTNADGTTVRSKDLPVEMSDEPTPIGSTVPEAVRAAIRALSEARGIPADQITVVSVEAVEWSDSCLGLGRADEACLMVITPGYRVVLSAGGTRYEFHTNASGSAVRQATP
jgi:hypothetical protein